MKKSFLSIVTLVLVFLAQVTEAVPVLLDSMLVTVDNQESTTGSTFSGSQNFNGNLTVPPNVTVDYFLVELTNIQITGGTPQSTVLEYIDTSRPPNNTHVESMTFFGNDTFGPLALGETLTADGTTYLRPNTNIVVVSSGMYDILSTFVNGLGLQSPWIALNSTSFTSAVDSPYIGLEFTVSAYGELPQIPIPPALWLFGSGLLGMLGLSRRKKISLIAA